MPTWPLFIATEFRDGAKAGVLGLEVRAGCPPHHMAVSMAESSISR